MYRNVLITGGIGSGKSAVCRYLSALGVPVYYSDDAARRIYDEVPEVLSALEAAAGMRLRDDAGRADRRLLAEILFGDPVILSRAESIVHPAVLSDFEAWKTERGNFPWCGYAGETPFVAFESAIALDKPLFCGVFDKVVAVEAPESLRLERACRRDSAGEDEVLARIRRQNTDFSAADAVIINDADLETLHGRTDIAFNLLFL